MPRLGEAERYRTLRPGLVEALENLRDWEKFFAETSLDEYFLAFFGAFPSGGMYSEAAMPPNEHDAVAEVHRLMREANEALRRRKRMSEDQFVATGWPDRIATAARRALAALGED